METVTRGYRSNIKEHVIFVKLGENIQKNAHQGVVGHPRRFISVLYRDHESVIMSHYKAKPSFLMFSDFGQMLEFCRQ